MKTPRQASPPDAGIDKPMTALQAAKEWAAKHPNPCARKRACDGPRAYAHPGVKAPTYISKCKS